MNPARRADLYARMGKDVAIIWVLKMTPLSRTWITTAFGPRGPWDPYVKK